MQHLECLAKLPLKQAGKCRATVRQDRGHLGGAGRNGAQRHPNLAEDQSGQIDTSLMCVKVSELMSPYSKGYARQRVPCAPADARHKVCLAFLWKRLPQLSNLQVPVPLSTPAELQHAPCHGAARLVQLCGICTALASTVQHVYASTSTCHFCGTVAELLNTEQPACCPARAARPRAADEDVSQRVQMPVSQACWHVCLQGQDILSALACCMSRECVTG